MKRLEEVLAELATIDREEVLTWIEARWVLPEPAESGPRFSPIDVARLRLIHELAHELAIDREAIPVVLSLIDEMYELRRRLRALTRALAEAPPELRSSIARRCRSLLAEIEEVADAG